MNIHSNDYALTNYSDKSRQRNVLSLQEKVNEFAATRASVMLRGIKSKSKVKMGVKTATQPGCAWIELTRSIYPIKIIEPNCVCESPIELQLITRRARQVETSF